MVKKILFLVFSSLLLAGCNGFGNSSTSSGGVLKSSDGGLDWAFKNRIDDKTSISSADILSMTVDPKNGNVVYVGTDSSGLYVTKDGGGNWQKMDYPLTKIYGLAINSENTEEIYATGVWQNRGKIYKSENRGLKWKEIYTEPADGTVVLSLAINKSNPEILLAGISNGKVVKTSNKGGTWSLVFNDKGKEPITQIIFDSMNENIIYFLAWGKGVFESKDGGESGTELKMELVGENSSEKIKDVFVLEVDPGKSGVVYAGTSKGLLRSENFGTSWKEIKTLSGSDIPVRSIAINPQNSNEIIYSSAQAIYKTNDGKNWSTFQFDVDRIVRILKYNSTDNGVIYGGLSVLKKFEE